MGEFNPAAAAAVAAFECYVRRIMSFVRVPGAKIGRRSFYFAARPRLSVGHCAAGIRGRPPPPVSRWRCENKLPTSNAVINSISDGAELKKFCAAEVKFAFVDSARVLRRCSPPGATRWWDPGRSWGHVVLYISVSPRDILRMRGYSRTEWNHLHNL